MARRAVVGVVWYDGEILLAKKRPDSEGFLAGEWHIPGETLESGETDEQGLMRGIREEAGVEIVVGKVISSYSTPIKHTFVTWYECRALSEEIKAGSDVDEVKWAGLEEALRVCGERTKSLWTQEIRDYLGLKS